MSETWYPQVQRRFRVDNPINQDRTVVVLTEYTWEQNEQGEVRNQVAKVLTEDGWEEFLEYAVLPIHKMPHISGRDQARQTVVANKFKEFERWIAAMIDFGNHAGEEPDTPAGETTTDNQGKEYS